MGALKTQSISKYDGILKTEVVFNTGIKLRKYSLFWLAENGAELLARFKTEQEAKLYQEAFHHGVTTWHTLVNKKAK